MYTTTKMMTEEERKQEKRKLYYTKCDEAAAYHGRLLEDLNVDKKSFRIKSIFTNSKGEPCVSIFANEFNKEYGFYIELVNSDNTPLDSKRTVYRIPDNPMFLGEYEVTEKNAYMVPCSELKAVNPVAAAISGNTSVLPNVKSTPGYMKSEPFSIAENEDIPYTEMTIRDFYAIYHNKPVSKRNWLNKLIQNTSKQ